MGLWLNRMINPNPVSWQQMQNMDLPFIRMSEFIISLRTIFIKMSLLCTQSVIVKLWTVNCTQKLSEVSTGTCSLSSAILKPMNLPPGLVSWFHESRLGFGKSDLKHKGFRHYSPNLMARGLTVGYETGPPIGWCQGFLIGWSKYRSEEIELHGLCVSCSTYWAHKTGMNSIRF